MTVSANQTLAHFRLIEKIGEGGMGIVWRARDEHLQRDVAVKVLPPGAIAGDDARSRFRKEALALSKLSHSNIATVHDFDTQEGIDFLVMEYVAGETLRTRIARGAIEESELLDLADQLLDGLGAAHAHGVIHRDLKPENVKVTDEGRLKILDFGLAKLLRATDEDEVTETMTRDGVVVGTLAYMAPEQVRGGHVDERTDIYAAGTVLYEMATGRRPHPEREPAQLISALLNEAPVPPRTLCEGLSPSVENAILSALKKEPERRCQTASELRSELGLVGGPSRTIEAGTSGHSRFLGLAVAGLSVVVLLAGLLWWLVLSPRLAEQPQPQEREKIVVLPFDNLGIPEDEYFADGITEEITSRLAAVNRLGVISRMSAMSYANSDKTTRQIGDELDVEYVLAGSVRWARHSGGSGRVRISPHLIRVADDTHLWAENYDRMIDDIFEVQSDIAHSVVRRLGITLGENERKAIEVRPTENLDAYRAFLQARYRAGQPHFSVENWNQVLAHYEQAVAHDSRFALAWAELSRAHARYYYLKGDYTEHRRVLAREAADRAFELAPDAPEVHLALGYYYLWVERDVTSALTELVIAESGLPNNVEVLKAKAILFRMLGRWDDSRRHLEQAFDLDPRDAGLPMEVAFIDWVTRNYGDALDACDEAIALVPDPSWEAWPHLTKLFIHWSWQGVPSKGRKLAEDLAPEPDWTPWAWYWQEMFERNYAGALERLESVPGGWIRLKITARPTALLEGVAFDRMGQEEAARRAFESARIQLEEAVVEQPEDPRIHSSLGIAYAALGRSEEAIREGRRGVELFPLSTDAFYGIPYVLDLAWIYLLTGDGDAAVQQLEILVSGVTWITPAWLAMDPRWDDLRDHPRFRELTLNSPELDE